MRRDEATVHEETCDGTFDPEADPNMVVETCGPAKKEKIADNEEWWKSFAVKAEKSDLDIKDIHHGPKVVLLLQIIGKFFCSRSFSCTLDTVLTQS